jgi:GTPase SAR1 family protein
MKILYIVGTAGSGKSTITGIFHQLIERRGVDIATVNLDPGVKWLPYGPTVDARDYLDVDKVAQQYNLGPNGALVASVDLLASHVNEIKEEIEECNVEYVLVDTPGQIELFAYRSVGPYIANQLGGEHKSMLYLFDANLVKNPFGFLSMALLGLSVMNRFFLPQINLLSKYDLLDPKEQKFVVEWSEDSSLLYSHILESKDTKGKALVSEMQRLVEALDGLTTLLPFSQDDPESHSNLFAEVQRSFSSTDELTGR